MAGKPINQEWLIKSGQISSESLVLMKASQEKAAHSISTSACAILFSKDSRIFNNVLLVWLFEAEFDEFRQIECVRGDSKS